MTVTELTQAAPRSIQIPQWNRRTILGVWALAALPMAALAWVVAPLLSGVFAGPSALPQAVIVCLAAGLIWQFVLTMIIVRREQRTLSWSVVRAALWLQAPRRPSTGRPAGLLWLVLAPCIVLFAAEELVPSIEPVAGHYLPAFLGTTEGQSFMTGNWTWFAIIIVMAIFNTVLGEELFFRGLLMPRMAGAFGRGDWVANGVLFALYHLHMPWAMPAALVDTFAICFASRRFRSSIIGIIVHSTQAVVLVLMLLPLVTQ